MHDAEQSEQKSTKARSDGDKNKPARTQPQEERAQSPFAVMRRMLDDMSRAFSGFTSTEMLGAPGLGNALPWLGKLRAPQLEVREGPDRMTVRVDLPGMTKDQVRIELEGNALVVRGERSEQQESEREGIRYSERSYGSFARRISLPQGVRFEDIQASMENGVLEVRVALPQRSGARLVDIKSRAGDGNALSTGGSASVRLGAS